MNNLKDKTILLVNTGPLKKKFIIQKLKKLGLKIVALHQEKNWAKDYIDDWILADTYNHEQALFKVKDYLKDGSKKINGAITFWEDDILLTSKIIDQFNFIGIPYKTAAKCRNKYLFRQFCQQNKINAPRHRLIHTFKDLSLITKDFQFPLVIKPAFGASSAYVVKVNNQQELNKSFNYIKNNISAKTESALTDGFEIFVEEYLYGLEVDVDVLIQNSQIVYYSISDNFNKNRGQFFVDSGQGLPSNLPANQQADLLNLIKDILNKLAIKNACLHFEAKATPKGPYPLELNLRMGGDYVYFYNKSVYGIDLIASVAKIATGVNLAPMLNLTPQKHIIGWDLHPNFSGRLIKLNINQKLKQQKYLEQINIYKKINDQILVPPLGFEHLGWLTVSGQSFSQAKNNLTDALKFIDFQVK